MARQRTYVMLKPGITNRRLMGEIIGRFERTPLSIIAMKMMNISRELCETHYGEHKGKPFYPTLIDYMTSGPVVAMVIEGEDAIDRVRTICGPTSVADAPAGTLRGDLGETTQRNVVHASDSPESAAREIALFFEPSEIVPWGSAMEK